MIYDGVVSRVRSIMDIGVPPGMPPEDAKYIQLINVGILIIIPVFFFFSVIYLLKDDLVMALIQIVVAALFLPAFLITRKGRYTAARCYIGAMLISLFVLESYIIGRDGVVHYWLFITASLASVAFPKKETWLMGIWIALCVGSFALVTGVIYERFEPVRPESSVAEFDIYGIFLALIIVGLVGRFLAIRTDGQLREANEKLKQLDQMKDNFLSMVSHDLRTPMTSIKGYASIMQEKMGRMDQSRQAECLQIIIRESDRLTRLISNLLDLQRFEAGKSQLALQEFSLGGLVEESIASFMGAAMAKDIKMEKHLPGQMIKVEADKDRLAQVMANFLSNAIKFTPAGGRVSVGLERVVIDGRDAARVWVSDTGPGIPREKQDKVFEKFQQVESLVREKGQGSGLGLALVREIIEMHGARVGLVSTPGEGSTFWFSIEATFPRGEGG